MSEQTPFRYRWSDIVFVFALGGPPIGGIAFVLISAALTKELGLLPVSVPVALVAGYLFGLIQACVAGIIYSMFPEPLQKPIIALCVGALVVLVIDIASRYGNYSVSIALAVSGGVASYICAEICRRTAVDRRARNAFTPPPHPQI